MHLFWSMAAIVGKAAEKKVAPNRVLDNKMGGTHGYRVPVCVPAQKCEASNLMPPPLKLLLQAQIRHPAEQPTVRDLALGRDGPQQTQHKPHATLETIYVERNHC